MAQKNVGLIAAIIFATVAVSGSMIFLGLQMGKSGQGAVLSDEDFAARVEQGIQNIIAKQEAEQREAAANQERQANEQAANVPKVTKADHIRGNARADISLIEYSDFECPYCQRFHATAAKIVEENGGKVNWVYRHFPLSFHDPLATKKAEASECAAEQGGSDSFWAYTDALYAKGGSIKSVSSMIALAKEQGLNQSKFKACLDSGKYLQKVQTDLAEGSKAGITGTPGNILINNKTGKAVAIHGAQPAELVQQAINQLLAE